MTTRKEVERQIRQAETLKALGFTAEEAKALRRISLTLRRWFELECGDDHGCIERDEQTQVPYWLSARIGKRVYRMPDRETGARKRLARIIADRNSRFYELDKIIVPHVQTDPRGAALYLLRPGDVPEGADVSSYYSRGVCVY